MLALAVQFPNFQKVVLSSLRHSKRSFETWENTSPRASHH